MKTKIQEIWILEDCWSDDYSGNAPAGFEPLASLRTWCASPRTKDELFSLFCSSFDEERPEVPMLFRDVPSLLIIFVLTMPQPLRKGMASKAASWHDMRGWGGLWVASLQG